MALRNLPAALIAEDGGAYGFVCIWRRGEDAPPRRCTVGEFLSRQENQSGAWLIDGGWGGPPGAVHVRWDAALLEWEYGGYCGELLREES